MEAFTCRMCGNCCYGEGGIYLTKEEIDTISNFLKIDSEEFLSQYCEKKHGRIYIGTGPLNFCIFFYKGKGCMIHPVKPERCSLWPYYLAIIKDKDNWDLAKYACPGINRDCSFEEFVRQSKK